MHLYKLVEWNGVGGGGKGGVDIWAEREKERG